MKKILSLILTAALAGATLTACSSNGTSSTASSNDASSADTSSATSSAAESSADNTADNDKVIKIGATATPHGEILEFVKDKLAKDGYDLQITIYDDYVLPNNAVASGELDANYHQHTPYLNNYNEKNGTDLVPAALIHYEPFGLYGNGVEKLADVKEGASIVIPADDSNETRALLLLQQEGLIELPEGANAKDGVTTLDIKDDHGYKITTVQADTVAAQFANSDAGSLAVINGNYALAAGLDTVSYTHLRPTRH